MTTPTLQLVIKMLVSGVFVGLLTEVAKRLPRVGGLVAALPLISLMTIFWLLADHQTNTDIAHFIRGVLLGLIPTTLFLVFLMILLERNTQFGVALIISLLVLVVAWIAVRAIAT